MLINTLSQKYIGNTTTNYGADMAISRRTDIQHDGHTQMDTITDTYRALGLSGEILVPQ